MLALLLLLPRFPILLSGFSSYLLVFLASVFMGMVLSKLGGMRKHVQPENEFLSFHSGVPLNMIAGSCHHYIYLLTRSYGWLIGLAMLLGLCGSQPRSKLLFVL